jgi:hypothetical protein
MERNQRRIAAEREISFAFIWDGRMVVSADEDKPGWKTLASRQFDAYIRANSSSQSARGIDGKEYEIDVE